MLVSTGVMSNISLQKNARTPEQNISLRNLCKNFWLEETAILDMQMSKLPMISGYVKVENIENANNTHIKQTKNECQQILPQWSSRFEKLCRACVLCML